MKKLPWGCLAAIIFVAMVGVMLPNRETRDKIVKTKHNVGPNEFVSAKQALTELDQITKEIDVNWGNYNGKMAYSHMNRLFFISSHLSPVTVRDRELERAHWKVTRIKLHSANARRDRADFEAVHAEFRRSADNDPRSWFTFQPVEESWNLRPLLTFWVNRYVFSAAFAFLFFVCLMMRRDFLWPELRRFFIFRLSLCAFCWPVAMWFFPSKDLIYQAHRGLQWANWFMSLVLSAAVPGLAKAQNKICNETKTDKNCTLRIDSVPPSAPPKPRTQTTYNLEVFTDSRHDRQASLRINRGQLLFLNQNRIAADGTSVFSHIGFGGRFKLGKTVTTSITWGPQFTYEKGSIDRSVLFTSVAYSRGATAFLSVNRLSFGHQAKTFFANRHIQRLTFKPLPSWISLNTEELHTNGRFRELFLGSMIDVGKPLKLGFLKGLYVFPFWDAAKGNFDMRFGYTHVFSSR